MILTPGIDVALAECHDAAINAVAGPDTDLADLIAALAGCRAEWQRHWIADPGFWHLERLAVIDRAVVNIDVESASRDWEPGRKVRFTVDRCEFVASPVEACRVRGRAVVSFEVEVG